MDAANNPGLKARGEKRGVSEDQPAKVVEWEDYEQELGRLCSLTSALEEAKKKKLLLDEKLRALIQIEADSLILLNKLDQMSEKLESRKFFMGNMLMQSKMMKEKVRKQEVQLSSEIRSLLAGGSSLSAAKKRMQDASRSLAGENGYGRLKRSQKLLRARQQYMVSQVSTLYPVKIVMRKTPEQELESFSSSIKEGVLDGSKLIEQGALTISGLHLTVIPFTKMSFFSDKKELQRSSTALACVAHAVSLIGSYLQVPLRYPVRFGGSRSFVCDYTPSIEISATTTSDSTVSASTKPVEFPLFMEGQDSTRAAYAVFLLNKDLEQLLNFIGARSLGPRHVLANLKELTKTILSPNYIDM